MSSKWPLFDHHDPFKKYLAFIMNQAYVTLVNCDYSALALWFSCSQRCLKYFQSQTFALERT